VSAPAPPRHYRRLAVLVTIVGLTLGCMVVRLVDIQVLQAAELREAIDRKSFRTRVFTPFRGRLVDRNGRPLAYSVMVKEVRADPHLVGSECAEFMARLLAGPLEMDVEELRGLLASNVRTNRHGKVVPDRYALLKKGVTQDQWARVQDAVANLSALLDDPRLTEQQRDERKAMVARLRASITTEQQDRQIRVYPGGSLACQVVGFVGHNPNAEGKVIESSTTGVEGLESALNELLRGTPGWQTERWVSRGGCQFYEIIESFRGRPGLDVTLTLDTRIQAIVEQELARAFALHRPKGMACVVVVPATGEVLAMANLPNFDPNNYGKSTPEGRRNRAVTDAFEPGSTFKTLSIAAALEASVVSLEDRVDCGMGAFRVGRRTLHDLHPYGVLTVQQVLAKSSNIGAARVGMVLGEARLYHALQLFGIGAKTGIPLPAEAGGTLHPLEDWVPQSSILSVPMGHEVAATPLQMTMAMAAIANGGRLMWPLLVQQVTRNTGEVVTRYGPNERGRAVSDRVARQMTQALQSVVEGPGGTGGQARLEQFTVAGKTGTADKRKAGVWGERHFASFIGFFPAEDPRLCIGVFVDEPQGDTHFGGTTAAPVFRTIATQAAAVLGIPPSISRLSELAQGDARSHLTDSVARSRM
jgi:cell division protein FtsI/penicillin-binding protein 2